MAHLINTTLSRGSPHVQIAWKDAGNPAVGFKYLYLSPEVRKCIYVSVFLCMCFWMCVRLPVCVCHDMRQAALSA